MLGALNGAKVVFVRAAVGVEHVAFSWNGLIRLSGRGVGGVVWWVGR